ncbi:MAG: hypothetical protein RLZZ561_1692 [Pseudomonadota bacterium]|jgi:hypothetical protein
MATLVFTAIGSALGGPIGGAIGSVIGQAIDQKIFAPAARNGPRLADLSVQSSSYGRSLPQIFGTMRVAGTVIWATDLREDRQSVSQSKGRPKANIYTYSASFAVALSARRAVRVGRIWADGKLLRGAAGDFKVATEFRFYPGTEDQPADPLIQAAEGAAETPAYRGLCYAVFEDMALDSFGNRIPILSFELVADEAPIAAGTILNELGAGALSADCDEPFLGYAADGGTLRAATAPIVRLLGLSTWDDGAQIRISGETKLLPVEADALGAEAGMTGGPAMARETVARTSLPTALRLLYADPARDHQPGMQTADLMAGVGAEQIDLPAATDAATAQKWAWNALLAGRGAQARLTISLPWAALPMMGGGLVQLPGVATPWQISGLTFEAMRIRLTLVPARMTPARPAAADSGRALATPDSLHGPTQLMVAELPWLDTGLAQRPNIIVAAAGRSPGWRRAGLMLSTDGGASWTEIGETAAPAVMGRAIGQLGGASPASFDRQSSLIVELLHDEMTLTHVDDDALLAGRNLMLVGRELVQFGRADRMGPARYRLSHLLRGRRGTEAEIEGHSADAPVLLLDRSSLIPLENAPETGRVDVLASGIGDLEPATARCQIDALAVRPLSPVHLKAKRQADGTIWLRWIRRSREGWGWPDGIETPLGEEREAYRLIVTPDRGARWQAELERPEIQFSTSQLSALRGQGATRLTCEIKQLGRMAASLPSTIEIEIP